MEIRNVWLLVISVTAFIVIIAINIYSKKKVLFSSRKKIANTKTTKELPQYQKALKQYKVMRIALVIALFIVVLSAGVLSSRLVNVNREKSESNSRDIILCLDVSLSMIDTNQEVMAAMRDIVKGLDNDRVGISIFHTTSVTLFPLTDDYDYIDSLLVDLEHAFDSKYRATLDSDESMRLYRLITKGTDIGMDTRGGSLTPDGLASCAYSFGDMNDKERSRSIIFSTDNEVDGDPYINLMQAAKLCLDNNIHVYSINPNTLITNKENNDELKKASIYTKGEYFELDNKSTVPSIINNIEEQEKSLIEGTENIVKTDSPIIPFISLVTSFTAALFVCKKVKV